MTELQPLTRAELTEHQRRVLDGELTRTDHVVSWIGWHIGELAAVGVPLLLAAAVTWWLAVLSVLAGVVWVAHEATHRRRSRDDKQGTRPLQAVPTDTEKSETSGEGIA